MKKLHQVEVTLRAEWKVTVYVKDPDDAEEVATSDAYDFSYPSLANLGADVEATESKVIEEVPASELSTEL